MKSNPIRYPASRPHLAGREREYVLEALESGWISGAGPFVERFEAHVSRFLDLEGGVAVCSGTAALHLALLACGAGPGDDVATPAFTFVACPNAVRMCGARPVFADCCPLTWNMTAATIEQALTPRTRGVMLVHLFGLPADVTEIRELCTSRGLWLLEDCAQAMGAAFDGRRVGGFGAASAFSFYGNKVISTGEGGMTFVQDPEARRRVRLLRNQGLDPQRHHWHPLAGFNYRMTNLSAAVGCGQMEQIAFHVDERHRIARRYSRNFAELAGSGRVSLPVEVPGRERVTWLYGIVLERGGSAAADLIRTRALERYGIQTRPFYIPMHRLPMYAEDIHLPGAEHLGDHGIVLPTYSGLGDGAVDEISGAMESLVREVMD